MSTAVKAFIDADLPKELIELLERIVLESNNPEFTKNRNLQNLLILTCPLLPSLPSSSSSSPFFLAMEANKEKTMDFVTRLNEYDPVAVSSSAIERFHMFEEAFVVLKKAKHNVEAISVLLDHLHKMDRAQEFADRVAEPAVYSKLGRAQLQAGQCKEAIDSFLKADDPESYFQVRPSPFLGST